MSRPPEGETSGSLCHEPHRLLHRANLRMHLTAEACGHKSPAAPGSRPGKTGVLGARAARHRLGGSGFADSIASFPQANRVHCGQTNEKSGGSNSSKMAAISIWPTLFRISR